MAAADRGGPRTRRGNPRVRRTESASYDSGRQPSRRAPAPDLVIEEQPDVELEGEQAESGRASALRSTRMTHASMHGRSMRPKGMSLRAKFMLVFSAVTGVSLILLGVVLSLVANFFLFSQTQHKGVEMAKLVSSLYHCINENSRGSEEAARMVKRYMDAATTWGDGSRAVTHINAVECSGLDNVRGEAGAWGPRNELKHTSTSASKIYAPGVGNVVLGEDVKIMEFPKSYKNKAGNLATMRVYRFRVGIREVSGAAWMHDKSHYVTLDMDIGNVYWIRNMLILIIAVVLVVSMIAVMVIASVMANKITRPVRYLLHDIDQVAQGDLDHQTRVRSGDEIGMLANAFNLMTVDLKSATVDLVEQEAEQKRAEYEMATAREVQQQLLPAEKPVIPGYELASYYKGAKAVSGDYYDYIKLGDELLGFIIADVSGKGIPGSMVMAVTRTIVRLIAAQHGTGAADTLKRTNRLIARQIKRGMFVTAFYAILDLSDHSVTFASAGHNPMVIFRAAQRGYELASAKGIAIGFDSGPVFDKSIQEFKVMLGPGDACVLYTDGFPEAMNAAHQEFGDENFYQAVAAQGAQPAETMVQGVVATIAQHRGDAPQSDDLTLITFRRTP